MANTSYPALSQYGWPIAPDGHFIQMTGTNDSKHTSTTATVYQPGEIPAPPSYIIISVLISFIPSVVGLITAYLRYRRKKSMKKESRYTALNTTDSNTKASTAWSSFLNNFRKGGITYNSYRTIALIVRGARMWTTHLIPSGPVTFCVLASLWSNVLNGDGDFDYFSLPALLAPIALWGLLIFECVVMGWGYRDYYFGSVAILGGNCPRLLATKENCTQLLPLGCATNNTTGLVSHTIMLNNYEGSTFVATMWLSIWTVINAFFCFYVIGVPVRSFIYIIQYTAVLSMVILIIFLATPGNPSSITYVDVGQNLNGSATTWTDCFNATEPSDRYGFLGEWMRQEWNRTVAARIALLGLV